MYAQDNDDQLPWNSLANYYGFGWAGQIYPYTKSAQLYTCPDDSNEAAGTGVAISYAYNEAIPYSAGGPPYVPPPSASDTKLSVFNATSLTVLLFECRGSSTQSDIADATIGTPGGSGWVGWGLDNFGADGVFTDLSGAGAQVVGGYAGGLTYNPCGSSPDAASVPRHTQGANYLLVDGHVKYMLPGALSPGLPAASPSSAPNAGTCGAAGTQVVGSNYAATWSPI